MTTDTAERDPNAIDPEEAIRRLVVKPDYDDGAGPGPHVHAYLDSAGVIIGMHFPLPNAEATIRQHGAREAGPEARSRGHSITVVRAAPTPYEPGGQPSSVQCWFEAREA